MVIALGIMGAAAGFGGAMLYVGGSLRQVDVNTAAIKDISDHGTGILQALKLQVQVIQAELDGIKHDFRPREWWEANAAAIATLQTKIAMLEKEKGCSKLP